MRCPEIIPDPRVVKVYTDMYEGICLQRVSTSAPVAVGTRLTLQQGLFPYISITLMVTIVIAAKLICGYFALIAIHSHPPMVTPI